MSQGSEASSGNEIFSSKKSKLFTNKRVSVVLDDLNFLLWKQQILLAVRSHRLEKLLLGKIKAPPESVRNDQDEQVENEEYELFVAQDSALASWLLSTISPHLLSQFVGAETTSEIWTTVTKYFASRSTTTIMSLHYKLKSLKKGDLSRRTYISQIKELCDSLAACGNPISEVEKIATILNGLHMEYKPFVTVITASREPFNLDGVVSVLVDAEVQQNAFDLANNFSGSVSIAQGVSEKAVVKNKEYTMNPQPYRQFNNSGGRGRSWPQCQLCGKIGHLMDSCWFRFDQSFQGVTAKKSASREESGMTNVNGGEVNVTGHVCSCAGHGNSEGQAQVQIAAASTGQNQWYVDSGATHHVTPEVAKAMQGSEYGGPGKITVGDGANLNITKIGKSVLPVLSATRKTLVLSDLMHVPQITKNLISMSKLARDNHVFLEFHAFKCVVRDEDTGVVLLEGRESEGLYKFDSSIDHSSWLHAADHNIAIKNGASVVQQRSFLSNSNELLIVPGVDKVKQLFGPNVHIQSGQGGPSISDDVTRGVAVEEAASEQEGVNLIDTSAQEVEVQVEAGDEHDGSQQVFGDTDLGRVTNTLDGSSQAEEMAAEATHGDEGSDPADSNGSGRAASALSRNEHDVSMSEDEGECENEEVDEAEIEAEPPDEENMIKSLSANDGVESIDRLNNPELLSEVGGLIAQVDDHENISLSGAHKFACDTVKPPTPENPYFRMSCRQIFGDTEEDQSCYDETFSSAYE
ncbi:hypothetical protein GQ457_06G021620 [Hibiscus cannabinus]